MHMGMTAVPQDAHRVAACLRNGAWTPAERFGKHTLWVSRRVVESPGCARLRRLPVSERFTGHEAHCEQLALIPSWRLLAAACGSPLWQSSSWATASVETGLCARTESHPKHLAGILLVCSGS